MTAQEKCIKYDFVAPLRSLYFFLIWDITQQCDEKFVYILVAVIVVANVFQLYLAIGL